MLIAPSRVRASLMALTIAASGVPTAAFAQAPEPPVCRRVGEVPFVTIKPDAAARLAEIGLDRSAIFERMAETSIPETMGCWAMPVGNFDSQLVSVGMSQWNFGTGSLQPVLKTWRDSFRSRRTFKRELKRLAPTYGKLLFSRDCLKAPVRQQCRSEILAAHGTDGKLNPTMLAELTEIFESDPMLQVQTDHYVELLEAVHADLKRLFPAGPITMRKVRWAIDTKVQQGFFPADEDLTRVRSRLRGMPETQRWDRLRAILAWYKGLSETIDQDGVARDYAWNVLQWSCMIDRGMIDPEQYELLNLTFLRSRTAVGNSGRWQALTFSRRAKIILDVGSVSGVRDGDCVGLPPRGLEPVSGDVITSSRGF